MVDKQRPETWIGKAVMLGRESSPEAELVRLERLTKWGAICTYQVEAELGEPVLIPWESVGWLRLATQEEERYSSSARRP